MEIAQNITHPLEPHSRMSCTSQLFTRLNANSTRQLKTSKLHRVHPYKKIKQSTNKQNKSYESFLRDAKSAIKIDQKLIVSGYLMSLRKQYDKMAQDMNQKLIDTNKMKKQIQIMRNKIKNQVNNHTFCQQKCKTLLQQLDNYKIKHQQVKKQTKTLLNMIKRMKQDQLVFKSECNKKQFELNQKKKQLKFKQQQVFQWDEAVHKIHSDIIKLQEQFNESSEQRELNYKDFKNHKLEKDEQLKFQYDRQQRTFELLSIQSTDVMDTKNIYFRQILNGNKFLSKLLQNKINNLLLENQQLQKSYHLIKTQTNITNPVTLAKKFFSYSQSLDQITATIRLYQQKQESLFEANQLLKQKQNQKMIRKLEQQQNYTDNQTKINEEKHKNIQQSIQKTLLCTKIQESINKIYENIRQKSTAETVTGKIQEILLFMKAKEQQARFNALEIKRFQNPNFRFKKPLKQFSSEQQNKRRSQAYEINQSNLYQNAYIAYQRKQVKRSYKNQFLIKTQQQKQLKQI